MHQALACLWHLLTVFACNSICKNVDLKISLYVFDYIKTIPRKFRFPHLKILELFARKTC